MSSADAYCRAWLSRKELRSTTIGPRRAHEAHRRSDFNQVVLRLSGEPIGAHPRRRSDSIGMPSAFLRRPLVPAVVELSN
jgi:hypothetical protein